MTRSLFIFWMMVSMAAGAGLAYSLPFFKVQPALTYINQQVRQQVFLTCVASQRVPSVKDCAAEAETIATTGKTGRQILYRPKEKS